MYSFKTTNVNMCALHEVRDVPRPQIARFGHMNSRSVAEVAKSWLLEVEDIVLNPLANTVLALDGVPGALVSLHPGATLRNKANRRRLSQSFELRDRGCSSSVGGVTHSVLRFWIKHTENISRYESL